jgi:hypothetical protein
MATAVDLMFRHSFGLIHGHLAVSHIFLDMDDEIQILDLSPIRLEMPATEVGRFSSKQWTRLLDIR